MDQPAIQVPSNVFSFIEKASREVGKWHVEEWPQTMFTDLVESISIKSPIEQLFYVAACTLCKAYGLEVCPAPSDCGIYIVPQFKVGKYSADFLLSQVKIGPDEVYTPVIVELDGHDFHDRNKIQRSYEKRRDREFVKKGYRVLHFTGSDVVSDPFGVAFEALDMVGLTVGSGVEEYDPSNPLNLCK